ncbi:MAG: hypothetical protein DMD83_06985 [Candidatus Rokuibacteriota bacterium]|nr:MAG: hypothetical protein DMD83_06985 [Candidatus Rokubacteria bacterium]
MTPNGWAPIGPSCLLYGQTGYGRKAGAAPVSGRATAIALDPSAPDHVVYLGTAAGGVWKSTDGGLNWTPKSDHEISLAIGAIAIHASAPATIWAGTGDGNDISADAYFGYGPLLSTNGGDSWELKKHNLFAGTRINAIALEPAGAKMRVMVACTNGLIESPDGGDTWTQTLVAGKNTRVASMVLLPDPDPMKTRLFVTLAGDGLYVRTGNGAFTRIAVNGAPAKSSRISLAVCRAQSKVMAVIYASPTGDLFVFRSADSGAGWAPMHFTETLLNGNYNQVIAIHPSNPDIMFVGEARLWRTTDAGVHWDIVSDPHSDSPGIHADQHALVFHPNDPDKTIWAANDGGIWFSQDGGDTWSHRNRGIQTMQYHSLAQHPKYESVLLGGTQDNGTQRFVGHPAWEKVHGGDGFFVGIDPALPNLWYASYIYNDGKILQGFLRSDDSGKPDSFHLRVEGLRKDDTPVSLFWAPFVIDPTPPPADKPHRIYLGTTKVYWSDDAGDTWHPVYETATERFSTGPANTNSITMLAVAPSDSTVLYVITEDGQFWRLSRQADGTWSKANYAAGLPDKAYLSYVAVDPTDANKVYVSVGAQHDTGGQAPAVNPARIFRGTVGGFEWFPPAAVAELNLKISNIDILHVSNPVNAIAIDPDNPNTVYIGCDIGIFRSQDGGQHWAPFQENLPNVAIIDLQFHRSSRLLRAATSGRSVWERAVDKDPATLPDVDLYVRDSIVDLGRRDTQSDVEDPLDLKAKNYWWSGADLVVDTPSFGGGLFGGFQTPASTVDYKEDSPIDYVGFRQLEYRHPRKGSKSRVYLDVLNRGKATATDVIVRAFWAARKADNSYPDLPPDFWSAFPAAPADTSVWHPIQDMQNIPAVPPGEARVVTWQWDLPMDAPSPIGILAVASNAQDPVNENRPQVQLVASQNKRVVLREVEVSFPVAEVVVGVLLVVGASVAIGVAVAKT